MITTFYIRVPGKAPDEAFLQAVEEDQQNMVQTIAQKDSFYLIELDEDLFAQIEKFQRNMKLNDPAGCIIADGECHFFGWCRQ